MKHIHGGDLTTQWERYPGVRVRDFSANINPLGMPRGVRDALAGSAEASEHYPDPDCRALRAAIAGLEGVPTDWILCGNGASDLIWRIAWGLLPGRALLPGPTFAEYEQALTAAGCEVRRHLLAEENGFAVGADLVDAINGAELVFLCNPNNPTGLLMPPDLLDAALDRCLASGAWLVVDECFLDFVAGAAAHTMKRRLAAAPNLLILRAFTKLFAMPGLRLGYLLCSNVVLLERIAEAGATWSVSAPAQLCGVAAVGERQYLAETRRKIPLWRQKLAAGLAELSCRVIPGEANYLLFQARPGLAEALRPQGILLRDCQNFRGLAPGWYRAAVRTPEENAALLAALRLCC